MAEKKNVGLAFSLDLGKETVGELTIGAADCYRLYIDCKLCLFGPQRAAHGYARLSKLSFIGRFIVVEVHSHFIKSFCWIKQNPFFACEIKAENKLYTAKDFACALIEERVVKVPRYSYQRGFLESYRLREDPSSYCKGVPRKKIMPIEEVQTPIFLDSYVGNAKLLLHSPQAVLDTGYAYKDMGATLWRDRSHYIRDGVVEGYFQEEWEDASIDDAARLVYNKEGKGEYTYTLLDLGREMTGFTQLEIVAREEGDVFVIYDEILQEKNGLQLISFERNTTGNVFKWHVNKGGRYEVGTFEPYSYRYAMVICSKGIKAELSLCDYENPSCDAFRFTCEDKEICQIVEAARHTLAQNSTDILMDCPSRERAGWLSDSYFSAVAELLFTGKNQAEKTHLENYYMSDKSQLPVGMVPMCYSSDVLNGEYIPNWALWYVLELARYASIYGKEGIVENSFETVRGIMTYFKGMENEDGVLENLQGWVFVEWSAANNPDHIKGVNIPTNACYAACLEKAGRLYGVEQWTERAEHIRKWIKKNAYNGKFFVDNLVRNSRGELEQTDNLTETCQYYLFWLRCIDKTEYGELYHTMMNAFGANRKEGALKEIAAANVMYGLYMRMDLLMRDGKQRELYEECKSYFMPMVKKTGTLWEHVHDGASCNHAFASYAIKWIIFALTGYDIEKGVYIKKENIGIPCTCSIPNNGKSFVIKVEA